MITIWKWTEWRNEIISPNGKKFQYNKALKNIEILIK